MITFIDALCQDFLKIEFDLKKNPNCQNQVMITVDFLNKKVFPFIWAYQQNIDIQTYQDTQDIYRLKRYLHEIEPFLKRYVNYPANCRLGEFYIRDVNFPA